MDGTGIVSILQQSIFVIVVFGAFLMYAMIKGRQNLINLIMGLYLALLISMNFPYYNALLGSADSARSQSLLMIVTFVLFTVGSILLFKRLMPREYEEKAFESFGKKIAFAVAATVLVLAFSYHALPLTEFINPGPINSLFAPEQGFFWWLVAPLVVLAIL